MNFCWVETDGFVPRLAEAQARTRSRALAAASSAPVGRPSARAGPTGHEATSELTRVHGALPSTGPAYSAPPAGVDLGPGPAAGVGDEQLGPVGPPVLGVEEPDLAQPGRPVRRAGHRRG